MADFIKAITALAIALLYFFFVLSLIEVVNSQPKYADFCKSNLRPYVSDGAQCPIYVAPAGACSVGSVEYTYNETGCATGYTCNTCMVSYDAALKGYNLTFFALSSVFGILAIVVGLMLKKKDIDWMLTGFMFGGFMLVFFGTIRYFEDMSVYLRPFVMLGELAIVVYTAYSKLEKK